MKRKTHISDEAAGHPTGQQSSRPPKVPFGQEEGFPLEEGETGEGEWTPRDAPPSPQGP